MNRLACGIKIPRRIVEIKKTPNGVRVRLQAASGNGS
jgi:hypothetical protein